MQIGPYTLISELAQGGMAQVWLAHRVWPDGKRRSCVIKLPRRNAVVDEGILRQFLEEGRLSILLVHNNIVTVFDVGVHEGLPYLVMDYVAGKDLSKLLRATARTGAPWEVETAVHVVREVGYGLLHAHDFEINGVPQRIIHRDVSSKNVMVDGSGGVLLADFGVATSLGTETSKLHAKGTLAYMAPEHYLGQACQASDAFGLGAILWELLAGRPFRGELEGSDLIAAVVGGKVDSVGRELPPVVQRVLDGMLHPDARQRMSLREVLQALEPFPNRRLALKAMVSVYFGREGRRTGLSQVHFAASKELVDALAVAKAAGVSVEQGAGRMFVAQPDPVPPDFVPAPVEDTTRVDAAAMADALDDDLDEDDESPQATVRFIASVGSKRDAAEETAGPTVLVPAPGTERAPAPGPAQGRPSSAPVVAAVTVRTPVGVADVLTPGLASRDSDLAARSSSSAGRGGRWGSFVTVALVLVLGLGGAAWVVWSRALPHGTVAEGSARAPESIATHPPRGPVSEVEVAAELPRERATVPAAPLRPEDEGLATSVPRVEALVSTEVARGMEHEELSTPEAEPAVRPVAPPLVTKRAPAPPKAAPPKPKVEVVLRRGLMVSHAEVRVGSGKPQVVPAKGELMLRVTAGTHTLRYRVTPEGDWKSLPYIFSADMKYAGHIEHNGLRLTAAPREAR